MSAQRKESEAPNDWMTAAAAARELEIARPTVLQRALLGELEFKAIAGQVFISRASVARAKTRTRREMQEPIPA